MKSEDLTDRFDGTELLTLLRLCGWRVRRSGSDHGESLQAVRDGVQVTASAPSFAEAIGSLFIRVMRISGAARGEKPKAAARLGRAG